MLSFSQPASMDRFLVYFETQYNALVKLESGKRSVQYNPRNVFIENLQRMIMLFEAMKLVLRVAFCNYLKQL